MYQHKLSKSRFLSGVQCEKKLYYDLYRKELKINVSEKQQELFSSGHFIGQLAQQLYPNGNDATPQNYSDFAPSFASTINWINDGVATIYEAAFFYDDVMAALDILHHQNGERWAIEVKSSTDVKDYHITDASLQYWVMNNAGFKPDKFFLMHVNNKFIKNGSIDPKEFFTLKDITDKVIGRQDEVFQNVIRLKNVVNNRETEPEVKISNHCSSPFSCDYMHHCWKHVPENSVFNLSNARGKEWQLYENGILELSSIPNEFNLSHRQKLQVEGIKHDTSYVDKTAIKDFISGWTYPLYFFDFETVFPLIPVLDGTTPMQQVPFQYSLHIKSDYNSELLHKEFLANPKDFESGSTQNPCKALIEQLKSDFGPTGSIVAYHASFEMDVLRKLAIAFPEDKEFLDGLIIRFVDLLIPFRKAWYYKPEMGNSASIKSVLPAIAPKFSYKDLKISNGGLASNTFLSMILNKFEEDEAEARKNLLAYCERDTFGMVVIWKHLMEL
jgi:hypothetical protein